jgi:hypothetical protein
MMKKMGFADQWIGLIMNYVSTGDLLDIFVPRGGLRQGDPLSPYLFLLCAEAISALLKKGRTGWIVSWS